MLVASTYMHTLGERSARPRARPPSCLQPWLPLAANPRSPMCGSPPPEGERERKEGEQRGGGRVKRESMRLIGAAYGNGGIRYGAGGELTRLIRNGSLDEFSGALLRVSCRVSVFALLHTDTHATHTHTHEHTYTHTPHHTTHTHTRAGEGSLGSIRAARGGQRQQLLPAVPVLAAEAHTTAYFPRRGPAPKGPVGKQHQVPPVFSSPVHARGLRQRLRGLAPAYTARQRGWGG
jgi:hypothetical protein